MKYKQILPKCQYMCLIWTMPIAKLMLYRILSCCHDVNYTVLESKLPLFNPLTS